MNILHRLHSSARPFVADIQREFTRSWNGETPKSPAREKIFVGEVDNSAIGQLPAEIKQMVCSFMSSRDLTRMSQVSCAWSVICSDEGHWKKVFNEERGQWDCIQSFKNTNSSLWEKFSQASSDISDLWDDSDALARQPQSTISPVPMSWKTNVILNHIANSPRQTKADRLNGDASLDGTVLANLTIVTQAIKSNTPALMNRLVSKVGQLKPFKKIYRIPMLGEGLESTSKDLLYSMMWPQNSSMFSVNRLYPGVEGFGSGVGFCVDGMNLNIAALHKCPLDDIRIKWKSYFQKADGVIYVVSSTGLANSERRQLKLVIGGEEPLTSSKTPILVLLVCEDPLGTKIRPSELAEKFNLDSSTDRPWYVQLVDMVTLKGLPEGLHWLASKV